jgi:hypothetical protein
MTRDHGYSIIEHRNADAYEEKTSTDRNGNQNLAQSATAVGMAIQLGDRGIPKPRLS